MVQFLSFLCSFSQLSDWSASCKANNIYAESMLSVTRTHTKMNINAEEGGSFT